MVLGVEAQQWREVCSQVSVGEPAGQETEDDQDAEQRLDAGVAEAQRGSTLAVDHRPGCTDPVERVFADVAVGLIRWTSRRRRLAVKPISRSAGRLCSRLPMPKSRVSLMVVSVRSARPSLWYCLIRECL